MCIYIYAYDIYQQQKDTAANSLLNVLPQQSQRNTFASILRRLRGSGPRSEPGEGDSFNNMSGHSFLRSRSA